MNLVSVPFYAAGNFVCDILNNTHNLPDIKGGLANSNHVHVRGYELHQEGNDTYVKFASLGKYLRYRRSDNIFIASHDYPIAEDCNLFDRIIVINLTTEKSILYRFARIYHQHYFGKTKFLRKYQIPPIDYMKPLSPKFYGKNVTNFEFEDLVEWKDDFLKFIDEFKDVIDINNLPIRKQKWQKLNHYLYQPNFLNQVTKYVLNLEAS